MKTKSANTRSANTGVSATSLRKTKSPKTGSANTGVSTTSLRKTKSPKPGSANTGVSATSLRKTKFSLPLPVPDWKAFVQPSNKMDWDQVHQIWQDIRNLLIALIVENKGYHFEMIVDRFREILRTNIKSIDRRNVILRIEENLFNIPPNWWTPSNCNAPTKQKLLSEGQCDVIYERHYNLLMNAAEFSYLEGSDCKLLKDMLEAKLLQNGLEVVGN
jgi:hypothetical protein